MFPFLFCYVFVLRDCYSLVNEHTEVFRVLIIYDFVFSCKGAKLTTVYIDIFVFVGYNIGG